jgi:hypothetical protein
MQNYISGGDYVLVDFVAHDLPEFAQLQLGQKLYRHGYQLVLQVLASQARVHEVQLKLVLQ